MLEQKQTNQNWRKKLKKKLVFIKIKKQQIIQDLYMYIVFDIYTEINAVIWIITLHIVKMLHILYRININKINSMI